MSSMLRASLPYTLALAVIAFLVFNFAVTLPLSSGWAFIAGVLTCGILVPILVDVKGPAVSAEISTQEIPNHEYEETFESLTEKTWQTITEKNALKKRKKFCDTLLRKGWESELVYEAAKKLEKNS